MTNHEIKQLSLEEMKNYGIEEMLICYNYAPNAIREEYIEVHPVAYGVDDRSIIINTNKVNYYIHSESNLSYNMRSITAVMDNGDTVRFVGTKRGLIDCMDDLYYSWGSLKQDFPDAFERLVGNYEPKFYDEDYDRNIRNVLELAWEVYLENRKKNN